ncbi:MAG: glycerophosphodiester phosphodiesterase [Oscillospiraceae bacterium]|nr:glycerophosphodiester phosphodiesterase [Oscillospiraceae bacterium]
MPQNSPFFPRRFAHRGVAQAAPENTIGAFEAAAAMGLEGIELDIHLSRDGVPVVIHDANLTRLTCGHPSKHSNARVKDLDWEALSQVEIPYANHTLNENPPNGAENEFLALLPNRVLGQDFNRDYTAAYADEPRMAKLMRLSDFLDWFADQAPAVMEAELEICAGGLAKPVFDLLDGHPAIKRCIVFSGHPAYICEMQELAACGGKPAGLRLGANLRRIDDSGLEDMEGMDLFEVGLNPGSFAKEDVLMLNRRGIEVLVNLMDTPEWWAELRTTGCYGFKTNYAGAFTRFAREWRVEN